MALTQALFGSVSNFSNSMPKGFIRLTCQICALHQINRPDLSKRALWPKGNPSKRADQSLIPRLKTRSGHRGALMSTVASERPTTSVIPFRCTAFHIANFRSRTFFSRAVSWSGARPAHSLAIEKRPSTRNARSPVRSVLAPTSPNNRFKAHLSKSL